MDKKLKSKDSFYFLFFFLCFVIPNCAWISEGHKMIAQVAYNMLNPKAKIEVDKLLGHLTITQIASWADDYGKLKEGRWSTVLHYVKLPFNATSFVYSRDCLHQKCVVGAIHNYTNLLKKSLSPFRMKIKKNQEGEPSPLAFLVHFVGDVHQPMHISYDCDRGGTLIHVKVFNKTRCTLHDVWDSPQMKSFPVLISEGWVNEAGQLEQFIQDNPDFQKNCLENMDPSHWANEGFTFVRNDCYVFNPGQKPNLDSQGHAFYYPGKCPIRHVVHLEETYNSRRMDIIRVRLAAAAIRLAHLLNTILS